MAGKKKHSWGSLRVPARVRYETPLRSGAGAHLRYARGGVFWGFFQQWFRYRPLPYFFDG